MYNYWFNIAGLAILLVIAILMSLKNSIKMDSSIVFIWLTVCCSVSTLSDLLSGLWLNHIPELLETFPYWTNTILTYVYYVSHGCCGLFYLMFVLLTLNIGLKKITGKILVFLPYLTIILSLFFNPFTHWIFTVDTEGIYHRGPLIYLVYGMNAIYFVVGLHFLLRYGKAVTRGKLFALLSFIFLAIAGIIVQFLHPYLLFENYCIDLCLLFVYLTMYRPEEVTDEKTGLLNANAFGVMSDTAFARKRPFILVFLYISDSEYIRSSVGESRRDMISQQIAFFLRTFRLPDLFHLDNGRYCMMYASKEDMVKEKALMLLVKRFELSWKMDTEKVKLTPRIIVVSCPQEAQDRNAIQDILDAVVATQADKTVLRLKDIDVQKERWLKEVDRISRTCVEENTLEVVYQPVYDISTKKFTTAEALVRLKDPILGRIPPDQLVAIAERNGSIGKIDTFVLGQVCDFLSQNTLPKGGINVNLSMVECVQEGLVERLCKMADDKKVAHDLVRFELTETFSSTFPDQAKKNLLALKKQGFVFCMDDFGQGYSNLDRLVSLPLDVIKLDREFISRANNDEKIATMMQMHISTLKNLGRTILIEGVETEEQAMLATLMGCDYIQGYYYSKPLSQPDFVAFLRKHEEQY